MGYYLVKRYFFLVLGDGTCEPCWVPAPLGNPVRYATWLEVADAYVQTRLSNVRVPGVPGYPAEDLDIVFDEDP